MKFEAFFQDSATLSRSAAFIWILLNFASATYLEAVKVKTLEPDITQYNEVMHHNQTLLYSLKNLYPYMTYELRISYPASQQLCLHKSEYIYDNWVQKLLSVAKGKVGVPTEFTIHVDVPNQSSSFKSRHLLNIDKSIFKTDSQTEGYVAEVVAHRTGFPRNPERHKDPIVFNICLEALHFGLTRSSWKVVCCVVVLCALSFKYLAPAALRIILGNEAKRKQ